MRRKCVIAQFEGVHEVTIPSLIKTLNRLGWTPTIIVNERCAERGDIFEHLDQAEFELFYAPLSSRDDWTDFVTKIRSVGPEFVLVNTFQREGIVRTTLDLGLPVVGLVHNASIFASDEVVAASQRNPLVSLLTLWDHVSHSLRSRLGVRGDNIDTYYLTHLADVESAPEESPRTVAITGAVDVRNRGLSSFLSGLASAAGRSSTANIQFIFCGGGQDRKSFEDEVAAQGLDHLVMFLRTTGDDGFVPYDSYISTLSSADFVGALLPVERRDYLDHKVTSGALSSLGMGRPLWADWATLSTYQLPGVGYPSDDIRSGVERLASLSNGAVRDLQALCRSSQSVRQSLSDRSLQAAIDRVMRHVN